MRFLIESRSIDHIFFSPTNDPFETAKVLKIMVGTIRKKHFNLDIVVAPLGTKMQAFGVLLFVLKNKFVRVVYPFPTEYSSNYSKGHGETWIARVNLSNII